MIDQAKIDLVLEAICQRGCNGVTQLIEAFERGELPAELQCFNPSERQVLLSELKSVMHTYQS